MVQNQFITSLPSTVPLGHNSGVKPYAVSELQNTVLCKTNSIILGSFSNRFCLS